MLYYRHGDVTLERLDKAKEGESFKNPVKTSKLTLALGETTGHSHTIIPVEDAEVIVFSEDNEKPNPDNEEIQFEVKNGNAIIVHEEHEPIILEPGIYHRQMKKQFNPFTNAIEQVRD